MRDMRLLLDLLLRGSRVRGTLRKEIVMMMRRSRFSLMRRWLSRRMWFGGGRLSR